MENKNNFSRFLMQSTKRKRRRRHINLALCIFQDVLFLFVVLYFPLNYGILACHQWVHQSFSHTADCFIEKWLELANSSICIKRRKRRRAVWGKKKKKKDRLVTGQRTLRWWSTERWRDRSRAMERWWRESCTDMSHEAVAKPVLLP